MGHVSFLVIVLTHVSVSEGAHSFIRGLVLLYVASVFTGHCSLLGMRQAFYGRDVGTKVIKR